jgi:hypothetical protein
LAVDLSLAGSIAEKIVLLALGAFFCAMDWRIATQERCVNAILPIGYVTLLQAADILEQSLFSGVPTPSS